MSFARSMFILSLLALLTISSCHTDTASLEFSADELISDPLFIEYFDNNDELANAMATEISLVDLERISMGKIGEEDILITLHSSDFSNGIAIENWINVQLSLSSQLSEKYNFRELSQHLLSQILIDANTMRVLDVSKSIEKNGSCEVDYALCVAAAYAQAQMAILACAGPWVVPCVTAVLAIEAIQIVRCDRAYNHCRAPER